MPINENWTQKNADSSIIWLAQSGTLVPVIARNAR